MRLGKGFTLVEVLVALAILSIIGVGIMVALGGASKTLLKADVRESARDLAQAQMENTQNQPYNPADPTGNLVFYPKLPGLAGGYPGYDVEIHAARVDKGSGTAADTGLQQITVIVKQGPDSVFTLDGMKVVRFLN
jgi:prepilin-type N-terminal cleavage/methylation domain-containing protein